MVNHLHGETSREKNVQEWEKVSRGELAKHTDTKRDALMPFSRDMYKMRKQNCESVNLAKTFCIRHTHSLHESLTGLTFSFSLHYTQRPFSAVVSIQILIFALSFCTSHDDNFALSHFICHRSYLPEHHCSYICEMTSMV